MMGLTIWSMHFVAMMAVDLPIPVTYGLEETLQSVGIAVVATGVGLYLASTQSFGIASIPAGGVLMGLGIAGMHYTGMSAIRGCTLAYDQGLVIASVAIAVGASMAALWLACVKRGLLMTLFGGVVQGLAIGAMHFTAMAATSFLPININPESLLAPLLPQGVLAVAIAVGVGVMSITNLTLVHFMSAESQHPG
jgi:NO-binding membrane sensor protein with MHYT domain